MKFKFLVCAGIGLLACGSAFAQLSPQPYEYLRGDVEVPCHDNKNETCIWHRLIVDNRTSNTLECRSHIEYDSFNRSQLTTLDHRMVVEPNTRKAVLGDTTKPDVKAAAHNVDCAVRPPLDNSTLTPKCKPFLTQKPDGIDYPPESRRAGEEGPVILEFSLSNSEGPPTDIAVVGSSLWPKLDESAVKYMSQHVGITACKKGRFRMPLTFKLR